MLRTQGPGPTFLWTTAGLFAVAMLSLWLLQELVDPAADSAQASTPAPAPATSTPPSSPLDSPQDLSLGRYIGPDGRIATEMLATSFLAGEAIHAAMAARNFSAGVPAQARWYGPRGKLIHREDIVIAPRRLRVGFVLPPARTGYRGTYRVEIHQGPQGIASRSFTVK